MYPENNNMQNDGQCFYNEIKRKIFSGKRNEEKRRKLKKKQGDECVNKQNYVFFLSK